MCGIKRVSLFCGTQRSRHIRAFAALGTVPFGRLPGQRESRPLLMLCPTKTVYALQPMMSSVNHAFTITYRQSMSSAWAKRRQQVFSW